MTDPILAKLYGSLDLAVLEKSADESFHALADMPDWWLRLGATVQLTAEEFRLDDEFPFLNDFLDDAESFWRGNEPGWLSSGFWQETLENGEICHLEATAGNVSARRILIVRRVDTTQGERLTIVQKGRENKLAYQRDLASHERLEAELRRAKQAAEDLTRAKSQFLAKMSHELRTPMAGVIGMAQLLLESEPTAEQRGYLDAIDESARSLLALINDILDFSRGEAGKLSLQHVQFSIRDLIQDTLQLLEAAARGKGLKISSRIEDNVPDDLAGDPLKLRQILFNLIGNAVKFTSAGEVSLTVDAQAGEPSHRFATLEFTLQDTGVGIPPEMQQTIFEAFEQAEVLGVQQFEGTGLGLSIARQLVELMGGRLWLAESSAEGTTFCFSARFELADHRKTVDFRADDEAPRPQASPRRLRVLVADDNEINRHVALRMLERRGHLAVGVASGQEVLEVLDNETFDAILMDCLMPGMDGFATATAIRRRESQSGGHLPIIALTAQASADDQKRCQAAGMDAHVTKPLDMKYLAGVLEELTGSRA